MASRLQIHKDELPLHFEGVHLKPSIRYAGWPVTAAGMAVGTYLVGTVDSFPVEMFGVLLAGSCALLFVALIRCRRFESVLGTRMLTVGAGPFRKRLPIGYIENLEPRTATSWRRLYSKRELVLRLRVGDRPIVFPSDQPEDLIGAIQSSKEG